MDAASVELTLLQCSPCFTAISGAQSQGLSQWIVGDRSGFHGWLQTSAHCLEQGEDTLPMSVIFAPPQCRNLEQIHAVCDASEVPEDSWDNDVVPVKIVLSQVLRKRRGDLSQEWNASRLCQEIFRFKRLQVFFSCLFHQ